VRLKLRNLAVHLPPQPHKDQEARRRPAGGRGFRERRIKPLRRLALEALLLEALLLEALLLEALLRQTRWDNFKTIHSLANEEISSNKAKTAGAVLREMARAGPGSSRAGV
jgi:hypothetical protein